MARVPYVSRDQLPDGKKYLLDRPNNFVMALANHPEIMETFMAVNRWIRFTVALDHRLREMAILQVGYSLGSGYEFSHHVKLAPEFGVSPEDIEAIIAESAGSTSDLTELESAVLNAARTLTLDCTIEDDDWSVIEVAMGNERAIELVHVIGYYNHIVRVMGALKVEIEPDYTALLSPYPPPPGYGSWR